ncbi:MAG: hypothetical protein IT436_15925 [Phycisphaerales bacterium]|nr:hypothetical protein [Phycisphaerales bacterium]
MMAMLSKLQADVEHLKAIIEDSTLSGDDADALEAYAREKAAGALMPHAAVRRLLGR